MGLVLFVVDFLYTVEDYDHDDFVGHDTCLV